MSPSGIMISNIWLELENRFESCNLDSFVVMPNHLHGIILIDEEKRAPTRSAPTLGDMIGAFKSLTTNEYIENVKQSGWQKFPGKLWQRNFFEHIVRNEKELEILRAYIRYNPLGWEYDPNNTFKYQDKINRMKTHMQENIQSDEQSIDFILNLDEFSE